MKDLKAGVARVDITPPVGTMMGGHRLRKAPSEGIHDPLYARALIFEQDKQRIAIVTTDLGAIGQDVVEKTRKLIENKAGIKKEAILISASHTHSGPDTFLFCGKKINESYLSILPNYLAGAVFWAANTMQLVKVGVGRGKIKGTSFNRRIKTRDGKVRLNWEKIPPGEIIGRGPVDKELGIIKVETLKGKLLATLVNFTLHAAVIGPQNLLFSADWPGYATKLIEEAKKDCVALFTNGAEGNINHIKNPGEREGSFGEAQRIGNIVGAEALKTLERIFTVSKTRIQAKAKDMKISLRNPPFSNLNQAKKLISKKERELSRSKSQKLERDLQYAKEILWIMEQNKREEEIKIQTLAIGDAILVGVPAEYFVEYGLEIKAESSFNYTFIVGLANGYIGYIPTLESFEEGGYEVEFCATSRFIPQTGERIKNVALKLIAQLAESQIETENLGKTGDKT